MIEQILALIDKHYPQDEAYESIISEDIQQNEIQNLKKTVKYEQFFFVLNIVERKIEYVHGIADWLGYADSTFSFYDYIKIIHPRHLPSLNMLADSAFKTANSDEFAIKFLSPRIIIQLPLKHYNGKYLLVKRTLSPFQINKDGRVLSYLNHFVILKDYNELDTLDARVGNNYEITSVEEIMSVKNKQPKLINNAKKSFGFNKNELAIIQQIADNQLITQKEICANLGLSLDTLRKTYNRRILSKARESFDIDTFKTIKDVAIYLKNEGYI